MFKQYSSNTRVLSSECPKCGAKKSCKIEDVTLYSCEGNLGVYLMLPVCSCGSESGVYTGIEPSKNAGSHAFCVLAKHAYLAQCHIRFLGQGKTQQEEIDQLVGKLDVIELKYENNSEGHLQFLGSNEFSFSR